MVGDGLVGSCAARDVFRAFFPSPSRTTPLKAAFLWWESIAPIQPDLVISAALPGKPASP